MTTRSLALSTVRRGHIRLLARVLGRKVKARLFPHKSGWTYPPKNLAALSNDELLSLMRHEAHRIEKAVYNNILETKRDAYNSKKDRIELIHSILRRRGIGMNEPTIKWSLDIICSMENLYEGFIQPNSSPPKPYTPEEAQEFVRFLRERRSVRVWAHRQLPVEELEKIALAMIDAARWAPTSGDRQPWRFRIITAETEKELLSGIKEEHCVSAPLLIFVGMDTRVYGALGPSEQGIYIDAGAAIMQMVLLAHRCGLGVCWNHFSADLIQSREVNRSIYANFAEKVGIGSWIAPVAIVAIGLPDYLPPEPARMDIDSLLLPSVSVSAFS